MNLNTALVLVKTIVAHEEFISLLILQYCAAFFKVTFTKTSKVTIWELKRERLSVSGVKYCHSEEEERIQMQETEASCQTTLMFTPKNKSSEVKQDPHTQATSPLPAFRKSPHMKLLIILLIELRTWEHLTNHNHG